ncbi:MAG: tetratricopeptide repeat protein [Betaproteobacteria bacterium]|nr:MAG: tetratricopeptide repeat protein [Betaproteobacteria bacterium]
MSGVLAERLTTIIGGPEDDIPLTEAALLVAAHRYSDLDVRYYLDVIEDFGARAARQIGEDSAAADKVVALNHYLFDELGFAPNAQDYFDPRNSFLNEVVERRTGIPITLSLVYMAVGNHLGLALNGVCYPGHFLVKCELRDGIIVLDPFSRGQSLDICDLQRLLRETQGGEVSRAIVAACLVAASKREILLRMLRNLKMIYMRNHELDNALTIMNWIVAANPGQAAEIRDRGTVYQELECFRAAVSDFERYLELAPDCNDGDRIRERVVQLQRSVSLLN